MLKTLVWCFLIWLVVVEGVVRIKTTIKRGNRENSFIRKFHGLISQNVINQTFVDHSIINQTLVDHRNDIYYTGIMHIGTPAKPFIVDFDTGSPTLWIAGKGCTYEGKGDCTGQKHRYDVKASTTGKDLGKKFEIHYGKGYAKGQYASDIVGLTPDVTDSETSKSFTLAYATDLSEDSGDNDYDGLFGLSFSSSSSDEPSYIEYLRDNKVFDPPIFTIWMDRNATGQPVGGEIIFGGRDPDKCGKDLITVPTVKKPWWTFDIEKTLLNGEELGGAAQAITDTGTSFIIVPLAMFKEILKKYPAGQKVECGKYRDIEFTIQIKGKLFTLTADDLIIDYEDKCAIGISYLDGFDYILLGDPFIKGYCQTHNYKDETLTLSSLRHPNPKNTGITQNSLGFILFAPLFFFLFEGRF